MQDSKTYGYLFEVDYDADGPHVRYGMDVSGCVSDEYRAVIHEVSVAGKAAQRIGAGNAKVYKRKRLGEVIKAAGIEADLNRAGIMFMRARMTGGSLYLIKTEEPLTFEALDKMLQNMTPSVVLREFLEKCKVF